MHSASYVEFGQRAQMPVMNCPQLLTLPFEPAQLLAHDLGRLDLRRQGDDRGIPITERQLELLVCRRLTNRLTSR